jgi:hypothetical protein
MKSNRSKKRKLLLVEWKNDGNRTEVFSSLKIFCLSYVRYDYKTLADTLFQGQVFENDEVRIERKQVL